MKHNDPYKVLKAEKGQTTYRAYLFAAIACRALSKIAVPALLIAASTTAQADCILTVQFSTQGNPALHPVTSIISQNGSFMAAENRHSYTIQLPCPAQYELVALLDNNKASRAIHLRTDSKIIVNMGN